MKIRLFAFVCAIGLAYFFSPRLFTSETLNSILLWLPLILTLALGELVVVIAGGIDISVGSVLGCSAMSVGVVLKSNPNLPLPLLFLIGAGVGLGLGLINGALVARAKLPPLIVTIGTLASFRGLAFLIGKGESVTGSSIPDTLTKLSSQGVSVGGVTVSWIALQCFVLAIIIWHFLTYWRSGRAIFAVGGQEEAASRRGISTANTYLLAFALSGVLAGVGGVMYLSRFGQAQPGTVGYGFELTVIATVAISGAKLTGGAGKISNLLAAAFIMSAITVSLSTLGIDTNWQLLVYGLVLLIMVCADGLRRKKLEVGA